MEIAKRAERRVRRIQAAFERRVADAQRGTEAQIAALDESEGIDARMQLIEDGAVAALAAALTGGDRD